jgi:hypothetical protein
MRTVHCQECVRAYLSIHDCLSFRHEVMICNHRNNRIICCQIFCDLLLKSAFEWIFNVMQLILVQIKWHIKWKYLIQKFHDICLSYYMQKKNWFTRHETDRFLNNHCQECVHAYLSIHDCLTFLHEVMIGNHQSHAHIICITVRENRMICCQIFCDLLLKSAFEQIFNVMQLILVQTKSWSVIIRTKQPKVNNQSPQQWRGR